MGDKSAGGRADSQVALTAALTAAWRVDLMDIVLVGSMGQKGFESVAETVAWWGFELAVEMAVEMAGKMAVEMAAPSAVELAAEMAVMTVGCWDNLKADDSVDYLASTKADC